MVCNMVNSKSLLINVVKTFPNRLGRVKITGLHAAFQNFVQIKVENLTRSGRIFIPGSGAQWTNGLDGSDGSDFTL